MIFHLISHFEFDGIVDDLVINEYEAADLRSACEEFCESRDLDMDLVKIDIVKPYCAQIIDKTSAIGEVFFIVEEGMCWPLHQTTNYA